MDITFFSAMCVSSYMYVGTFLSHHIYNLWRFLDLIQKQFHIHKRYVSQTKIDNTQTFRHMENEYKKHFYITFVMKYLKDICWFTGLTPELFCFVSNNTHCITATKAFINGKQTFARISKKLQLFSTFVMNYFRDKFFIWHLS